jgi:hypothetical protein
MLKMPAKVEILAKHFQEVLKNTWLFKINFAKALNTP